MARIGGIDLPGKKRIVVALQYLYGVGQSRAMDVLEKAEVDPEIRAEKLTEKQLAAIRGAIESAFKIEGELRKEVSMNIKRMMDLGAYRGLRHRSSLPVRGQRTHTNARTRKGKPRIAIAGKKQAPGQK